MSNESYVVSDAAKALHQKGREAGGKGDYAAAIDLFSQAAKLAPAWPYPVYDRAFSHLLMGNATAAAADYRQTVELEPRGFFTSLTAAHTLTREEKGELPTGVYLAFVMLEFVEKPAEREALTKQLVEKYPQFAPGYEKLLAYLDSVEERLKVIERGLAANPDRGTKGMLLLNKAMMLDASGDSAGAKGVLNAIVSDPESTLANQTLAKTMLGETRSR